MREQWDQQVLAAQKLLIAQMEEERYEDRGFWLAGIYYRGGLRSATDGRMAIAVEVDEATERDHLPIQSKQTGRIQPDLEFIREGHGDLAWTRGLPTPKFIDTNNGLRIFWGDTGILLNAHFYVIASLLPDAEWAISGMESSQTSESLTLREHGKHRWFAGIMPIKAEEMGGDPIAKLLEQERYIRDEWLHWNGLFIEAPGNAGETPAAPGEASR